VKVKVKDLKPNPFRDLPHYPIDRDRVEILKNSIDTTGFWDNILARKNKDGDIEIAYGHHRLVALKEALGPNAEIDLPVRPLEDEDMLKIMANENETMFAHDPRVVIETVKQAKAFLEKSPDVVKKLTKNDDHPGRKVQFSPGEEVEIGTRIICRFLGKNWNEHKVSTALAALKQAAPEVIEKAPSLKHVEYITRIPDKEAQKRVLEKVRRGREVDSKTKERRPLTVDETLVEVTREKMKSQERPKEPKQLDLSDVIGGMEEALAKLHVLLTKSVIANWKYVRKEQKQRILALLGSFIAKIQPLYKEDKNPGMKLIESRKMD